MAVVPTLLQQKFVLKNEQPGMNMAYEFYDVTFDNSGTSMVINTSLRIVLGYTLIQTAGSVLFGLMHKSTLQVIPGTGITITISGDPGTSGAPEALDADTVVRVILFGLSYGQ